MLKVDGAYAAVKFINPSTKDAVKDIKENAPDEVVNLLQDCRLLRKDDLQVKYMLGVRLQPFSESWNPHNLKFYQELTH